MTPNNTKPNFLTNRSTILCGQACPRKQWLEYYWDGTGLTRRSQSVPLATGSHVHEGVAQLMLGSTEDSAAQHTITSYRESVVARELTDDIDGWLADEQAALAEALVRVHARECMPVITNAYDIVTVEADDCRELTEGIGWQFRLDATLRSRLTGGLTAYSLKTASQWSPGKADEITADMQGLSEAWGLEQASGEECESVKMDFLVKGKRQKDRATGRKETLNHLIRAWMSTDVTPRYAWRWVWTDDSGREQRLSAAKWKPFYVWEVMGVKEWIDMLWSGSVQPEAGHPRRDMVISYPPIFRNPAHIDRWKRQTIATAARTWHALGEIVNVTACDSAELDVWFPQHTARCVDYNSRCPFWAICHEGGTVAADPLGSGEFIRRDPHHSATLDGGGAE